jgi:hypothetical protein
LGKAAGLAQRLGQRNRSGERDVERAGARGERNDDPGIGRAMHEIGHPGAFATEEQRIAGSEIEAMKGDVPARRQQDEAAAGVAAGQKRFPRGVAAYPFPCDIIERCAAQPPVVDEEPERLDQIDLDGETDREAQQRPGILRDIGLIEGEAQIVLFRVGLHTTSAAL